MNFCLRDSIVICHSGQGCKSIDVTDTEVMTQPSLMDDLLRNW